MRLYIQCDVRLSGEVQVRIRPTEFGEARRKDMKSCLGHHMQPSPLGDRLRCCWLVDATNPETGRCFGEKWTGAEVMHGGALPQCAVMYEAEFDNLPECVQTCRNNLRSARHVRTVGCESLLPGQTCHVGCAEGTTYAGGGPLGNRTCSADEFHFGEAPFCIDPPPPPKCGGVPPSDRYELEGCENAHDCRAGKWTPRCNCKARCKPGFLEVAEGMVVHPTNEPRFLLRSCVKRRVTEFATCEAHASSREECIAVAERPNDQSTIDRPCCYQKQTISAPARCLPIESELFDHAPEECGSAATGVWQLPVCQKRCKPYQVRTDFEHTLSIRECEFCTDAICNCSVSCASGFERVGGGLEGHRSCDAFTLEFPALPLCGRPELDAHCPLFIDLETKSLYPGRRLSLAAYASYVSRRCVFKDMLHDVGSCEMGCASQPNTLQWIPCKQLKNRRGKEKGESEFWKDRNGSRGWLPAGGCRDIDHEGLCLKAAEKIGQYRFPCCWRQAGFRNDTSSFKCTRQGDTIMNWDTPPDMVERNVSDGGGKHAMRVLNFFKCTAMKNEGGLKLSELRRKLSCEPQCMANDLRRQLPPRRYSIDCHDCAAYGSAFYKFSSTPVMYQERLQHGGTEHAIATSSLLFIKETRAVNGIMWGEEKNGKWVMLWSEQERWANAVPPPTGQSDDVSCKCKVACDDSAVADDGKWVPMKLTSPYRVCLLDDNNTAHFDEPPACTRKFAALYPQAHRSRTRGYTFANKGKGSLEIQGCTNCLCGDDECPCRVGCAQGMVPLFGSNGLEKAIKCILVDGLPRYIDANSTPGVAYSIKDGEIPHCSPTCPPPTTRFNPVMVAGDCDKCALNLAGKCVDCRMKCPKDDSFTPFGCFPVPGNATTSALAEWRAMTKRGTVKGGRLPLCGEPFRVHVVEASTGRSISNATVELVDASLIDQDLRDRSKREATGKSGMAEFPFFGTTARIHVLESEKFYGTERTVVVSNERYVKVSVHPRAKIPLRLLVDGGCRLESRQATIQATLEWNSKVLDLNLWVRSVDCAQSVLKRYRCSDPEKNEVPFSRAGGLTHKVDKGATCRRSDFYSLYVRDSEAQACGLYNMATKTTGSNTTGSMTVTVGDGPADDDHRFVENQFPKYITAQAREMRNLHKVLDKPAEYLASDARTPKPMPRIKDDRYENEYSNSYMRLTVDTNGMYGPEHAMLVSVPPGRYQVVVNLNSTGPQPLRDADPVVTIRVGSDGLFKCRPFMCSQKMWMAAELVIDDDLSFHVADNQDTTRLNRFDLPTKQKDSDHFKFKARRPLQDSLYRTVDKQDRPTSVPRLGVTGERYKYWKTAVEWAADSQLGPGQEVLDGTCGGECWSVGPSTHSECVSRHRPLPMENGRFTRSKGDWIPLDIYAFKVSALGWRRTLTKFGGPFMIRLSIRLRSETQIFEFRCTWARDEGFGVKVFANDGKELKAVTFLNALPSDAPLDIHFAMKVSQNDRHSGRCFLVFNHNLAFEFASIDIGGEGASLEAIDTEGLVSPTAAALGRLW